VTDLWSDRAQAFRDSPTHREGEDLDLVVEWCEPGPGVTALDVATGGGHVARRLREAGANVVSSDPAPGMQPDVICRAEHLPFADGAFDVVVCRIAPHHFDDIHEAMHEMARVAGKRVVVEDNMFTSDAREEAEKLRDPSHVRCYSEDEWRSLFDEAGLEVGAVRRFDRRIGLDAWLERVECTGEDEARVRALLADVTEADGTIPMASIVLRGRKR
jgi:SAM-dependent methyltransferase